MAQAGDPRAALAESAPRGYDTPAGVFVVACAHRDLSDAALAHVREVGLRLDTEQWRTALGIATLGGIASLVYAHAAAAGLLAAIPEEVRDEFSAAYRTTLVSNLRLRNEQATLLARLAEQGIEAVAVKGVALALRYYGNLALRPVGDIDLLVRRSQIESGAAVLREMGYVALPGSGHARAFGALRNRALVYLKEDGPTVELHWDLASVPPYAERFATSAIWGRTQRMAVGSAEARYLDPADELRYLCFHYAAQHYAERLIWLVDIAELVGALPADWDWLVFVNDTREAGLALPMAYALALAQQLLDLAIPTAALAALTEAAAAADEGIAWRVARARFTRPDILARYLLAFDAPADRAHFLRGALPHALRQWASDARDAFRARWNNRRMPDS
ncbi:MAG: hypothetical protein OJF49_000822 [Ktedonobacterales bacterium]|nr:MAG: hypothetical protein OJF49_000822 [Ktedonobacterales bacterium]